MKAFPRRLPIRLLALAAISASLCAHGGELDKVPMLGTSRYAPQAGIPLLERLGTNIAFGTIGNIYLANHDIGEDVYEKLASPDLRRYFPDDTERRAISRQIANEVKQKRLQQGLSNDSAISAVRLAVDRIVAVVAQRVLEKEGVASKERRALWPGKLLANFHACMDATATYSGVDRCLDPLQGELAGNLGLALSYEMVRQEFGESRLASVPAAYRTCMLTSPLPAGASVRRCALGVVRSAAKSYGAEKLKISIAAQLPGPDGSGIAAKLLPEFGRCIEGADARESFLACGDRLVILAGGEVVQASIEGNAQVRQNIPDPAEVRALAMGVRSSFRQCMDGNLAAGRRTPEGMLQVEGCAGAAKAGAMNATITAIFRKSIDANLRAAPAQERQETFRKAKATLDACWDRGGDEAKNSSCTRASLISVSQLVAGARLAREMPKTAAERNPALKARLLARFSSCLSTRLPQDVLHATSTEKIVEACGAGMARDAALAVGRDELTAALKDRVDDPERLSRLTAKLVDGSFASCLGAEPAGPRLDSCTLQLRRDSGDAAAQLLFPKELDRFLEQRGGNSYPLSPEERGRILETTLKAHSSCLKQNLVSKDSRQAEDELNGCFKRTIQDFSGKLGRVEFERVAGEGIPDRAELGRQADRFQREFSACLDERAAREFSVDQYVDNLKSCQLRLTKDFTRRIARAGLSSAFDRAFPAEENGAKREGIESRLLSRFDECFEEAPQDSPQGREACVKQLKAGAVEAVLVESVRLRAAKDLGARDVPPALAGLEGRLHACLERDPGSAEGCGKAFAQDAVKWFGDTKLDVAAAAALGAKEVPGTRRALAGPLRSFHACVDGIALSLTDEAFLPALESCGRKLEAESLPYFQGTLREPLLSRAKSPESRETAELLAQGLPCLSEAVASGPYTPWEKMDPDGTLASLADLIAGYVNYDDARARGDIAAVLEQFSRDLAGAGPETARENLLKLLVARGALDQLLKSAVLFQVKTALDALPKKDRPAPEAARAMLDRGRLEKALTPELMASLRPVMTEKLLRPVLMEGASVASPAIQAALGDMQKSIASALLASPDYGAAIIQEQIQAGLSSHWKVTLWMGGFHSRWDEVKASERGQAAEAFIREQILRPSFVGESVDPAERQRRDAEAERLVKAALKKR